MSSQVNDVASIHEKRILGFGRTPSVLELVTSHYDAAVRRLGAKALTDEQAREVVRTAFELHQIPPRDGWRVLGDMGYYGTAQRYNWDI